MSNILIKQIKNVSNSEIEILGFLISPDEIFTLDDHRWNDWIGSNEAIAMINDGTLLVGNGVSFFTDTAEGLRWFLFTGESLKVFFQNDSLRNNGIYSETTQEAIEEVFHNTNQSPVGKLIKVDFSYAGTAKNRWLELYDGISSDKSPYIFPFKMKLIAMTTSTMRRGADFDIEFYYAPKYIDGGDAELKMIRDVRDTRATVSRFPFTEDPQTLEGLTYNFGDRLAIFLKDRGYDVKSPVISLYFVVMEDGGDLWDDYSGNMSNSDSDGWWWEDL